MTERFRPDTRLRYIKLGPGGAWAERSIASGEIHFGHREVPHDLAMTGDKAKITAVLIESGRLPSKGADFAHEIVAFYTEPETTVWITFHRDRLWWARSAADVHWLGVGEGHGARMRRTIGSWRDTDLAGNILWTASLSSRLTKVEAYRQTICAIEASDYCLARLNGEQSPLIARALQAREATVSVAADLVSALHWRDFETLIDVMLARGGWHRVSALGGTMKDADLKVEQAVTAETATVQIKSEASQRILDEYVSHFETNGGFNRLIFVCHSPRGVLSLPGRSDVTVWSGRPLAEAVIRNGLIDWLIERAG